MVKGGMKLSEWLIRTGMTRTEFARQIGVTGAAITGYCNGSMWPSKPTAALIVSKTGGMVTPNDFLPAQPSEQEQATP